MESIWKHRDIKLVAIEKRRNYLVSQQNHHYYKVFHRKFVGYNNENKNTNIHD